MSPAPVTVGPVPATLSRALRTHLNGVLGMTELTLGTDLDEQQRLYLVMARASALALLRCVESLEDHEPAECDVPVAF